MRLGIKEFGIGWELEIYRWDGWWLKLFRSFGGIKNRGVLVFLVEKIFGIPIGSKLDEYTCGTYGEMIRSGKLSGSTWSKCLTILK